MSNINELNEKQRAFIDEYVKDKNATQAAIRAGYSEKTAYSQGQRLLKKVEIKEALEKNFEVVRESNIATAREVEEFLSLVMRGELTEEVVCPNGMGDTFRQDKKASLKDRLKAAEMLAKRYGIDKPEEKNDMEGVKVEW